MKQMQKLQRIIFTIFVIAGLGLISSPSGMNTFGDFKAMMTIKSAFAAGPYGIVGQTAPELRLTNWIDGNGEAIAPIHLSRYRGKVVYLYFFQDW